ncbi:hypothetical protein AB1Y20_014942 [Prymnesium parvum]|uniref:Ketoreductase domain-containing protein n=1 Tax=Prymnesium parvum TaxID=97485 RepID=A0AB34JZY0_PRYPA
MPATSLVAGAVAIVTGGSGAIGRAISGSLALSDRTVVITGRRRDALEAAAESIVREARRPVRVIPMPCDVTDEEEVGRLFDRVASDHGPCGLLVNCAGIAIGGQTESLSSHDFSRVLAVNVLAPFICSKFAIRQMKARGGGRIINIGSISAESPRPDSAPYTTSKFALAGLTRSLALDGRQHNIAVGIIHPGNVISELLSPEEIERRRKTEGFISPDDVAACVQTMAGLPLSANVLEMSVMPTSQPLVGRG